MPIEAWSPVVYGRTFRADSWWRAVPDGMPYQDWLGAVVSAVVSGGDHLDQPRFLLARLNSYWVTGVACMAAELSEEFTSDGRRPLYTFVGWAAPWSEDNAPPTLDELRDSYRQWASPLYAEWVGRDWNAHASQVREPHASSPLAKLWLSASTGADGHSQLSVRRRMIELLPAAEAKPLWEAGLRTRQPFVLAIGWAGVQRVPRTTLTHATVEGLTAPEHIFAEPGGLDLASEEPSADKVTSWPRPQLTIEKPTPVEPASRFGAVRDFVKGALLDESAWAEIRIRLLVVTSDDQVLVIKKENGFALPYGPVHPQELPGRACQRVARDSLGLVVSETKAVQVDLLARSTLIRITFSCALASEKATVTSFNGDPVTLLPVTDPTLPKYVRAMLSRLDDGRPDIEYLELEN